LSAGPERVVNRLQEILGSFATALQTPHVPELHSNLLREFFVDEVEADRVEISQMVADANAKSLATTGKPLSETVSFEQSFEMLLKHLSDEHDWLLAEKNALTQELAAARANLPTHP